MVTGFKRDGVFHPITQYRGVSRNSRVRYANGIGSSQQLNEEAKSFAKKIKQRYEQHKAQQQDDFNRELSLRRKYESRLISAYRLAKRQQINDPKKLERFIRSQIPDLPNDKTMNKFVVNVLRDFKKSEEELARKKKGKSEAEQKALEEDFTASLKASDLIFQKLQKDQETKFAEDQKAFNEKIAKQNEKLKKEVEQAEEARKNAVKKAEDARKTAQNPNATEEEKKKTQEEAGKAEQSAKKEEKESVNFAQDVYDELRKEAEKVSKETEVEVGFPEGII